MGEHKGLNCATATLSSHEEQDYVPATESVRRNVVNLVFEVLSPQLLYYDGKTSFLSTAMKRRQVAGGVRPIPATCRVRLAADARNCVNY